MKVFIVNLILLALVVFVLFEFFNFASVLAPMPVASRFEVPESDLNPNKMVARSSETYISDTNSPKEVVTYE